MEERGRLHEAITARAWPEVFDLAARLVALGDEGEPPGLNALWVSVAAGRMGRWYDALFYAGHSSRVAGTGTDVEAMALCNLSYFYVQYGAPESATQAGSTFMANAALYSPESAELTARVLQHMASARELVGEWSEAVQLFRRAASVASDPGLRAVALVDAAYTELKQGPHRLEQAEQALNEVSLSDLDPRGKFAYHVVLAHLLHSKGDLLGSNAAAEAALDAAPAVGEPLNRELAMVKLVQARNAFASYGQGAGEEERVRALSLGFEAALAFQQQHQVTLYEEARAFLRGVLNAT